MIEIKCKKCKTIVLELETGSVNKSFFATCDKCSNDWYGEDDMLEDGIDILFIDPMFKKMWFGKDGHDGE